MLLQLALCRPLPPYLGGYVVFYSLTKASSLYNILGDSLDGGYLYNARYIDFHSVGSVNESHYFLFWSCLCSPLRTVWRDGQSRSYVL